VVTRYILYITGNSRTEEKGKKHQKERKVIQMKITSNQRAVHSFIKKMVSPEDGLVGPKHVVTIEVTYMYVLIELYDTYILTF
jgi:hypothetical protein